VLATKKIDLWQLPDLIIIHLKRFQHRSWKEKLDTFVDYPLENLDLSPYVLNPQLVGKCTYDLVAVIVRIKACV
jgi:ubiquitin C-terminal hydrolase